MENINQIMAIISTPNSSLIMLRNIHLKDDDYETGFDQGLIDNWDIAVAFQCSICLSIPRHPIYLDQCGHWFCEICIEKHYQINKAMNYDGEYVAKCPLCQNDNCYKLFNTTCFEAFSIPLQRLYRAIRVKCPYGCEKTGHPLEMDQHQTFECKKRMVACPNPQCTVEDIFERLETDHFPICPHRNIYCCLCQLPVTESERASHSCVLRQALALECVFLFNLHFLFDIHVLVQEGP